MARVWKSRPRPWVAKYVCSEEEMADQLPPEYRTVEHRTTYRAVDQWGTDGCPLVFDKEEQRLVPADSLENFVCVEPKAEREGEDWRVEAHGVMPGLCGVCVAVVTTTPNGIRLVGPDGTDSPGMGPMNQHEVVQVLHDMASGEWGLYCMRTDSVPLLQMAAVAHVAGTAVCAEHAGRVAKRAGLI